MKKFSLVFVALVAMVLTGCNGAAKFSSMNAQRAGLRDAADIAATLAVDNVSDANVDKVLSDTESIAKSVIKFLDSGNIGDLTSSQIRTELVKLIPVDYIGWVDLSLNYVSQYSVDTGKIGNKTVAHLKEFFYGITIATDRYKKSDRPVVEAGTKNLVSLEADKVKYNMTLKKQMK
jgi:hypothetical protein